MLTDFYRIYIWISSKEETFNHKSGIRKLGDIIAIVDFSLKTRVIVCNLTKIKHFLLNFWIVGRIKIENRKGESLN